MEHLYLKELCLNKTKIRTEDKAQATVKAGKGENKQA
jgi:hypothetical protein